MIWPFKRRMRPPEQWIARSIRFVGEQDGPPERELKDSWVPILQCRPEVQRAYLARVIFDNRDSGDVVLAVRSTAGYDPALEQELGKTFMLSGFLSTVHLDVVFLTPEQDGQIAAMCPPFYPLGYTSYLCAAGAPVDS